MMTRKRDSGLCVARKCVLILFVMSSVTRLLSHSFDVFLLDRCEHLFTVFTIPVPSWQLETYNLVSVCHCYVQELKLPSRREPAFLSCQCTFSRVETNAAFNLSSTNTCLSSLSTAARDSFLSTRSKDSNHATSSQTSSSCICFAAACRWRYHHRHAFSNDGILSFHGRPEHEPVLLSMSP